MILHTLYNLRLWDTNTHTVQSRQLLYLPNELRNKEDEITMEPNTTNQISRYANKPVSSMQ